MSIRTRILRYVSNHQMGVSAAQIDTWLRSCKDNFTIQQIEAELKSLRDEGKISCRTLCVNSGKPQRLWWARASNKPDEWYFVAGVRYCAHCRTRRCVRQQGGTLPCVQES